tara:strand:- start:130 stop:687 length:558 start_codon:yes stop_codon:yes gene_type:complete
MSETLLKSNLGTNPLLKTDAEGIKDILLSFEGISLAGLETITDARALKTGNPFKNKTILKQSRLLVNIGGKYHNWLKNQAKREQLQNVEFIIKQRTWGEKVDGTSLIYYDKFDKFYLEVLVVKVFETIYTDIDGNVLTRDEVKPFLPKKKESKTQDVLTKKVYLRDYTLTNIRKFAFDTKVYLVG